MTLAQLTAKVLGMANTLTAHGNAIKSLSGDRAKGFHTSTSVGSNGLGGFGFPWSTAGATSIAITPSNNACMTGCNLSGAVYFYNSVDSNGNPKAATGSVGFYVVVTFA